MAVIMVPLLPLITDDLPPMLMSSMCAYSSYLRDDGGDLRDEYDADGPDVCGETDG